MPCGRSWKQAVREYRSQALVPMHKTGYDPRPGHSYRVRP